MTGPGDPRSAGHELDLAVAQHLFDGIARLSADVAGVSRPAFSTIETAALDFLADFARDQGLAAWSDAGVNGRFALPGDQTAEQYVLVGSHIDSVPRGGNFDGLAGVVAGLVCLLRARRQGRRFARPVQVVALRGEESAWFGPCYIGSKALTGTLSAAELGAHHKGDGRELAAHMADAGLPVAAIRQGVPLADPGTIAAYLELHIEQGPLLLAEGRPAAVVSGIRGNFRHRTIRCLGEAGHSGAVPRACRRDPVLAMADLLMRLDAGWSAALERGEDLVLTCGVVGTDPASHAMSRIADQVSFSLDLRSQSAATLQTMRALLHAEMAAVGQARGVRFEPDAEIAVPSAICDPGLVARLKAAMARCGHEPFVMASGGGHDAAVFAGAGVPAAMIFVRNANGSHNPHEAMALGDFLIGTDILHDFLMTPAP